jgi:hypothetical protein
LLKKKNEEEKNWKKRCGRLKEHFTISTAIWVRKYGSIVFLVPDKGWDFNPGKMGLKKSQEIINNLNEKGGEPD